MNFQIDAGLNGGFESGDVLVFNGSTDWNVRHGIDEILPHTCPEYLPPLEEHRISLQFRDITYVSKRVKDKLTN